MGCGWIYGEKQCRKRNRRNGGGGVEGREGGRRGVEEEGGKKLGRMGRGGCMGKRLGRQRWGGGEGRERGVGGKVKRVGGCMGENNNNIGRKSRTEVRWAQREESRGGGGKGV